MANHCSHGIARTDRKAMVHMGSLARLLRVLKIDYEIKFRKKKHSSRIKEYDILTRSNWYWITTGKGIAGIAVNARTNRTVVVHTTFCIGAAYTRTWINAFLIYAGLVMGTFSTNNAFGTASGWGANERWQTRANRLAVDLATLTVRATWRWLTRVFIHRNNGYNLLIN